MLCCRDYAERVVDMFQPKMSPLISLSGTYRKKFLLFRNSTNSWCRAHMYILTCFPPFYIVSKIGLSTITCFLIHICFQMLLSWHWIMFCTLFWCIILNNVCFEGSCIFTLHQHTSISNITIWRHSCHII